VGALYLLLEKSFTLSLPLTLLRGKRGGGMNSERGVIF